MFWSRVETETVQPAVGRPSPAALAMAAMALIALLPFAVASIPSMTDWAGHVGRYHVMLHPDAGGLLARYYSFHWRLVGNLGVDLPVRAIGPWLGAERAGWLVTALIPPLTITGLAAVSRALHGRVQPPATLAAAFVLGNPFLFGFVNYCLAVALALLVFAGWIALARRSVAMRLVLLTPAVLTVWIAHAMGWAVLALLVAGYEGAALWRARRSPWPALAKAAVLALAFAPPIALTLAWGGGGAGAMSGYAPSILTRKLMAWVVMLRGGEAAVDIGVTLLTAGIIAALLWRRAVRIDARMAGGAALLAAMVMAAPTTVFGSWGADERLAPVAAMAALLALRWQASLRAGRILALAAALLFAGRTAVIAGDWHALDRRYQASLAALDHVPQGARIEVLVLASRCHAGWRQTAWPHLAALAIPRRAAFVNVEWALGGAPLLGIDYPLPAALRYDPSQMVDAFDCAGRPTPGAWRRQLDALPTDRLDYAWLLDTHGMRDLWPGHRPVSRDDDGALYALHPGRDDGRTAP